MLKYLLFTLLFAGCEVTPPDAPTPPPATTVVHQRAVLELYLHEDGKTRCVDGSSKPWAAYRCCPDGFSPTGFSVRAATEYQDGEGEVDRTLYRHLVCVQDVP